MSVDEKEYSLDSYLYDLPQEKIAPHPLKDRSCSKLLLLEKRSGKITDSRFNKISECLKDGDLLVLNDSRVIKARLSVKKETGGRLEVLLIRPAQAKELYDIDSVRWEALINPSRGMKCGTQLQLENMKIKVLSRNNDGHFEIELALGPHGTRIEDFLKRAGEVPIPPYIKRRRKMLDEKTRSGADELRYQNVYAGPKGSVAAPTAGFHFDDALLNELEKRGVKRSFITLHVGPGTFKPIDAHDIRDHKMDREWYRISDKVMGMIDDTKSKGGRVIAVGTTSVRVLETVFSGKSVKQTGFTDLFIKPGFDFKAVDAIITNFHVPGSTLILLVSAFAGRDRILEAYRHAIGADYRFYSYGDSMFIF